MLCLSLISFLSDLFIPNKFFKATKNCSNTVFICEFHASNPIQVAHSSISSYLREPTALETTKRTQQNGCSPTSILLW